MGLTSPSTYYEIHKTDYTCFYVMLQIAEAIQLIWQQKVQEYFTII